MRDPRFAHFPEQPVDLFLQQGGGRGRRIPFSPQPNTELVCVGESAEYILDCLEFADEAGSVRESGNRRLEDVPQSLRGDARRV
jgi:hypothetical protein